MAQDAGAPAIPGLLDTHCHLTNERYAADLPAVLDRATAAGVTRMLLIGTGLDDARQGAALAAADARLATAAGLDPFTCHERHAAFADDLAALDAHLSAAGCVALGEIGLEYHHAVLPRAEQHRCLHAQLALAQHRGLPVILHCRDAHHELPDVLAEHPGLRGVIHSFDGGPAEAERYLALGLYLSLNGMATFKRNEALRAAAALIPAERLLLETDAPYLSPEPLRGRRNEPAHLVHTALRIAALRGVPPEELAQQTSANAATLLGLGD